MPKKQSYFDKDDIELLGSVLELIPDLDAVAYAAKLARSRLKYPINSYDELNLLFDGKKSIRFKNRLVLANEAEKFVPKEFFPIETEHDLLCRLMIVFQRAQIFHLGESMEQPDDNQDVENTWLPSPAPLEPSQFYRQNK